jgi:hypothetical protein
MEARYAERKLETGWRVGRSIINDNGAIGSSVSRFGSRIIDENDIIVGAGFGPIGLGNFASFGGLICLQAFILSRSLAFLSIGSTVGFDFRFRLGFAWDLGLGGNGDRLGILRESPVN